MSGGHNDTPRWDLKTSIILKNVIYHEFVHLVDPNIVLSLLISKMPRTKVLCDKDISKIKAVTKSEGRIEGAGQLLECLSSYFPSWFTVLQEVLRDPSVRQSDLANIFDQHLNEAYELRLNETIARPQGASLFCRADSTTNQAQSNFKQHANNSGISHKGTEDDFDLDEDQAVSDDADDTFECDYSSELMSDMPKPKIPHLSDEIARLESRPYPDPTEETIDTEETLVKKAVSWSVQADPDPSYLTEKKGTSRAEDCSTEPLNPSEHGYESIEYGYAGAKPKTTHQLTSAGYENIPYRSSTEYGSKTKAPVRKQSSDVGRKLISEFSFAETETALSKFTGWYKKQTDRDVIETFRDILDKKEDGRYLLWYWEKKKRPAICVSFKGKLITFIIHRKRDKSNPTRNIYYVDKTICKPNLDDLFKYHLEHGLPNMKDSSTTENIKLTHPIKPRT